VPGLNPGSYIVKVRAQSPAGNGSWSTEEEFTIEERAEYVESSLILPVGIGVGALFIVLILVILYYVCFRR